VPADVANIEVNTPGGGNSTVNIHATSVPTRVNCNSVYLQPNTINTVNVGNNGSVQGIAGALTLYGEFNATIDDLADVMARNATFGTASLPNGYYNDTYSALTGLAPAPIYWPLMDTPITVKGGSGGNTFTVADMFSATFWDNTFTASHINLDTGVGADTVNVQ